MSCRKRRFDKIGAEIAIARNMGKYHVTKRFECRYYFCDRCNAYHLTSESKRQYDENRKLHAPASGTETIKQDQVSRNS